jgi:hypothetical protein
MRGGHPFRVHKLLCDANLPGSHLLNRWAKHFVRIFCTFNQRQVHMRADRIFLSLALAIGCGIALQSTASSQEYRGTWEQQRACTPDVWRLCGAQIPDVDRIVACLRRNTSQLSDRCRAVFAQSDAPSRDEDRGYGQRRYNRDYAPRPYDRGYGPSPYDRDYGPRPSYGPRPYDYDDE